LHQVLRLRSGAKNSGMREKNLLSLSYGRIVRRDIDSAEGLLPESFESYQIVEAGDIILRLTDLQNDKRSLRQGLVTERGIITSAYDAVRPYEGYDPRFWFYFLFSLDVAKYYYSLGAGVRQSIRFSQFPNDAVAFPSPAKQQRIADFLDRETAHIDRLIEKKERLIALLEEKRSALITRAVTKGLDPDVRMKDSGVEWIGEIPEHWEVTRLKFLLSHFVDCLHSTPTYSDEGEYPAIRTADVDLGALDIAGARRVDRSEYEDRVGRLIPMDGDILYSREGERFGHAALVPAGVELCLSQRMVQLRAQRGVDPGFLMWALNSRGSYQQAALDTLGATSPHVNLQTIRNILVTVPPLPEQEVLRRTLEGHSDALASAVAIANGSISLLRERRSALITAAVTGQIDVEQYEASHRAPLALEDHPPEPSTDPADTVRETEESLR
jgi:type I restriction enzyme, S subunit